MLKVSGVNSIIQHVAQNPTSFNLHSLQSVRRRKGRRLLSKSNIQQTCTLSTSPIWRGGLPALHAQTILLLLGVHGCFCYEVHSKHFLKQQYDQIYTHLTFRQEWCTVLPYVCGHLYIPPIWDSWTCNAETTAAITAILLPLREIRPWLPTYFWPYSEPLKQLKHLGGSCFFCCLLSPTVCPHPPQYMSSHSKIYPNLMNVLCLDVTQYNLSFKNNSLVCPIIKKGEKEKTEKVLHLFFFNIGNQNLLFWLKEEHHHQQYSSGVLRAEGGWWRDQRWLSDSHLSAVPFSCSQVDRPSSLKSMLLLLSRRTR